MPTISVLIKPASGMCNMQCDYCFYCDEMKKKVTGFVWVYVRTNTKKCY